MAELLMHILKDKNLQQSYFMYEFFIIIIICKH